MTRLTSTGGGDFRLDFPYQLEMQQSSCLTALGANDIAMRCGR